MFVGGTGPSGGVFRSEDRGSSYSYIGLSDGNITAIAVDPFDTKVLLVSSHAKSGLGEGIFLTRSGGEKWTRIHSRNSSKIVFDPQTPGSVIAIIEDGDAFDLFRTQLNPVLTAVESTTWGRLKDSSVD